MEDHAYAVLDFQEVENNRLIKLRNPWGSIDWHGDWSPSSNKWTEELKQKLDYKKQDDIFWLSYEDFIENFEIIHVCKISNW